MAQELDIDIKVTGLADLRSQLKAAKDDVIALQSADVIDPNKLAEATKRAGALKDALNDANEQIKVMSGGSDFEKVSNGLGLIGSQLADMDFEGAANSAKNLTKVVQAMNPATVAKGFSDLAGTVLELGKAFVSVGLKLLMNPLFLIPAIIVAVVVAIVMLKDKLKIAEQAFDLLMRPIKALIQGLKDLTDWLGITSFAEEEAAQKSVDAANKRIAANEKVTASVDKEYSRQIALAKANGEDTTKLEIEQAKAQQVASSKAIDDKKKIVEENAVLLDKAVGKNREAAQKTLDDSKTALADEIQNYKDARNNKAVIQATSNTKAREDAIKAGQKSKDDQDKADKAAEDAAKRHLAIIRGLRDLELSNMEEGLQKDLSLNQEKYKRELEDLKTNKDMTKSERAKYAAEYLKQKEIEDKKAYKAESDRLKENRKKRLDEEKKLNDDLKILRENYNNFILEQTGTPFEKEMAAIAKKYQTEKDLLKKGLDDKLITQQEFNVKMAALTTLQGNEQAAARKKNSENEKVEDINNFLEKAQMYLDLGNTINGLLNQLGQNRLDEIKNRETQELDALTQKQQQELNVTGLSEAQKQAINDKYAKLKYETELKAFQQTEKIKKQQFARDKAARMAGVIMDTARGVMAGYKDGPIIGSALSIITLAQGAIQLATIAAQKYQGEAGPSAPSIGGAGGGGSSIPVEPSINLFGQRNSGSTATAAKSVEANQNIMVTAVVSETEITNVQGRANRIRQSAEL